MQSKRMQYFLYKTLDQGKSNFSKDCKKKKASDYNMQIRTEHFLLYTF